jgi:hypothetical protein
MIITTRLTTGLCRRAPVWKRPRHGRSLASVREHPVESATHFGPSILYDVNGGFEGTTSPSYSHVCRQAFHESDLTTTLTLRSFRMMV